MIVHKRKPSMHRNCQIFETDCFVIGSVLNSTHNKKIKGQKERGEHLTAFPSIVFYVLSAL